MATSSIVAIEFASRIAAGQADGSALRWAQRGFAAFVRAGGAVPLERCLGLPRSERGVRMMRRNYWLAEAAKQLRSQSLWLCANDLAEELDRYLSRGPWGACRHLSEPPEGTSALRSALFHVAVANEGKSLSAKQIHRVLRQALGY